jgi:uncharacterized protein (TIGR03083 family)
MPVDNSAGALTDQLDDVWTSLAFLGAGLTDEEWGRPTPCPGWSVAAQYAHVIGTESMLLGRPNPDAEAGRPAHVRNDIGGFNEVWVVALGRLPREQVLAQFDEVTAARRQVLAAMSEEDFSAPSWTPIGQADYRRFMQIRVFDCWVHEQDIRVALGRPGHQDGAAAEQAVDEIVRALGYIVGKKAGAPAGSRVTIELTGPVKRTIHITVDGRAQVVDDLDGPATASVALGSTPFTRLACGRVDPAANLGDVQLAGDTDLAGRIVANLPFTI